MISQGLIVDTGCLHHKRYWWIDIGLPACPFEQLIEAPGAVVKVATWEKHRPEWEERLQRQAVKWLLAMSMPPALFGNLFHRISSDPSFCRVLPFILHLLSYFDSPTYSSDAQRKGMGNGVSFFTL